MNYIIGIILIIIIVVNLIAGLFFDKAELAILVFFILNFILPFLPRNDN